MFPPTRRLHARPAAALAAVVVTLLLASGCDVAAGSPNDDATLFTTGPSAQPAPEEYVAMGDSYTAAPLQPLPSGGQIQSCLRSRDNYPTLVARRLGAELTDVSCSGASTTNVLSGQNFSEGGSEPPQLDVLSDQTDLITLGVGANDFGFFAKMIFDCLDVAPADPQGNPCQEKNRTGKGRDRLEKNLVHIKRNVARAVRVIGRHAPEARILLIGYPQLIPKDDVCRGKLPLARGDYPYVRKLNLRLAEAVEKGGTAGGAQYIDLVKASRGHDICAHESWVAGIRGRPRHAMGLHPYPREQQAVADLIIDAV